MTREEAVIWLKSIKKSYRNLDICDVFCNSIDMAIEALQEPERKRGRWEDFDYDNSYRCTACGEIWTLNDGTPKENNMNYCPNCGADM